MLRKGLILSFVILMALAGCNHQEAAQPRMEQNKEEANQSGTGMRASNVVQRYDHPYNHNYDGDFSGAENTSAADEIRSAQQVASRAAKAAEKVPGVKRAVSAAQGIDLVVGIEADHGVELRALEQKVKQAVSNSEQGYNVFVTADPRISERIRTLFTNMNNVKTSHVTTGIGEIIYDIGRSNGQ